MKLGEIFEEIAKKNPNAEKHFDYIMLYVFENIIEELEDEEINQLWNEIVEKIQKKREELYHTEAD